MCNQLILFGACLDDWRQLHEKLWLHPETAEWDESPETGHEPCRQAASLPISAPPQLQQEDAAADRQDLIPARGSWGRSPRHSPLTGQTHKHTRARTLMMFEAVFFLFFLQMVQIRVFIYYPSYLWFLVICGTQNLAISQTKLGQLSLYKIFI